MTKKYKELFETIEAIDKYKENKYLMKMLNTIVNLVYELTTERATAGKFERVFNNKKLKITAKNKNDSSNSTSNHSLRD